MANTGHKWSAFAYVLHSGGSNWDGTGNALIAAAGGSLLSDVIEVDQKSAIVLGFQFIEDDTGATSGDMTISILGAVGPTNYEVSSSGQPFKVNVTPVRNATIFFVLPIDVTAYNKFEVEVENNSTQIIGVKLYIQTADIPVAS